MRVSTSLYGGSFEWGTALQAGRLRVRFPKGSLRFVSDFILPGALRSTQPLTEMNTRNISWNSVLCGQNAEFVNVKPGGTYSNHWAREGFICLFIYIYIYIYIYSAVAQWLKCWATNRKVAGSIPDGVTGIFHCHNPSDRTVALGSTQPLTEINTRSISWW